MVHETNDGLDFARILALPRCLFRADSKSKFFIPTHVDDLTLICDSKSEPAKFKIDLAQQLDVTNLGPIHWLLGIRVKRDRKSRTISLTQTAYIDSIVSRFHLDNARPLTTPLDPNVKFTEADLPLPEDTLVPKRRQTYQEVISSLMYAAPCTRPNILFTVTFLSSFLQLPGKKTSQRCPPSSLVPQGNSGTGTDIQYGS
jgi:hypothetical protein